MTFDDFCEKISWHINFLLDKCYQLNYINICNVYKEGFKP